MQNSEFRAEPQSLSGTEQWAQVSINKKLLVRREVHGFSPSGIITLRNSSPARNSARQQIWLKEAMGLLPGEDTVQIINSEHGSKVIEINQRGHSKWGIYSAADIRRVMWEAQMRIGKSGYVVEDFGIGDDYDRALEIAIRAQDTGNYDVMPDIFDEGLFAEVETNDLTGKPVTEVRFDFSKTGAEEIYVGVRPDPIDGVVIHNGVLVPKRYNTPLSASFWGIDPRKYYTQKFLGTADH